MSEKQITLQELREDLLLVILNMRGGEPNKVIAQDGEVLAYISPPEWYTSDKKEITRLQSELEDAKNTIDNMLMYSPSLVDAKIAKLEKELQKLNEATRWRKVEDELPEGEGRYQIRYKHGAVKNTFIGDYYYAEWADEFRWNAVSKLSGCEVTHWMPLPDAPTESNEG
jgi:hypothetical protein